MLSKIIVIKRVLYTLLFKLGIRGTFKTLLFNFKYLNFYEAIHFPVLIGKLVCVKRCNRGSLIFGGGG